MRGEGGGERATGEMSKNSHIGLTQVVVRPGSDRLFSALFGWARCAFKLCRVPLFCPSLFGYTACYVLELANMADEHHDLEFENAESGASHTFPMQAGSIKKGGHIVIKGRPCKVPVRCAHLLSGVRPALWHVQHSKWL